MYKLSINPEPEMFCGIPMYFWCVLRWVETNEFVNCGHGWADSVEGAAAAAEQKYKEVKDSPGTQYVL